jgi:hypothetical protein
MLADIHRVFAQISESRDFNCLAKYFRAPQRIEIFEDTLVIKPPNPQENDVSFYEIAAFAIDFASSNKVLTRRFDQWLIQRRRVKGYPEKGTKDLKGMKVRLRTELNNLGAFRLRASGLTARQATKHTEQITGKPLYANEPAWSDAVQRAERVIDEP